MAHESSMPFLGRLDATAQQHLLALGRPRRYAAHAMIFFEDDDAHDVLVVRSGEIKVAVDIEGREVILDVLGEGDLLGELSAIDGGRRSAAATALSPAEVITIPAPAFMDFLATHPTVALDLLRAVASHLRQTSRRQVEYGGLDALGRVCRRLVEMMDRYGRRGSDGVVITGPLSQRDIAAWAGLSREAVVKALAALRILGWVSTSGRAITVLDPDAVTARASVTVD